MHKIKIDKKAFIHLYIILTLIAIPLIYSMDEKNRDHILKSDFLMLFTGAKIVNEGNIKNLYDFQTQQETQKQITKWENLPNVLAHRNPPLVATILSPLANLEYIEAFHIMLGFNLTIAIGALILLFKQLKLDPKHLFIIYITYHFLTSFYFNQISTIIFFTLILVYCKLANKKYFVVGLITGLLTLKPQYLLITPFLLALAEHRKRFVQGAILSISLFTFLNLFLVGLSGTRQYLNFLFTSENLDFGSNFLQNLTLVPLFFGNQTASNFTLNSKSYLFTNTLLYFLSIILVNLKKKIPIQTVFASIVIFSMILNTHVMAGDHMFLLIPTLLILSARNAYARFYKSILTFFAFFITFSITLQVRGVPIALISLIILLMGLIILLLKPQLASHKKI